MKKGFTIIELLGVIILLSLLTLLVYPTIINFVKDTNNDRDSINNELIYNAANLFIKDNINDYPKVETNVYCISLDELVARGYLNRPITMSDSNLDITDTKTVEVKYIDNKYAYSLVSNENCSNITIGS